MWVYLSRAFVRRSQFAPMSLPYMWESFSLGKRRLFSCLLWRARLGKFWTPLSCSPFVREKLTTGDHQEDLIALLLQMRVWNPLVRILDCARETCEEELDQRACMELRQQQHHSSQKATGTYLFVQSCPAVKQGFCRHLCKKDSFWGWPFSSFPLRLLLPRFQQNAAGIEDNISACKSWLKWTIEVCLLLRSIP